MAFQGPVFQTVDAERAFELAFSESLTLAVSSEFGPPTRTLTIPADLTLAADAEFDPGGPSTIILRFRIFARRPGRHVGFPTLTAGANEALAEPILFFDEDSQVNLDFTILNPDGTAYNLTGATVVLLAKPERGAVLSFACTLIDEANGKARRTVAANNFAAGPYQAQIRVTVGAIVFHTVYFRIQVGVALE